MYAVVRMGITRHPILANTRRTSASVRRPVRPVAGTGTEVIGGRVEDNKVYRMAITLRAATMADLDLLKRWDEKPHVVESDPNDDWNWETELDRSVPWREQLIAEADGVPIGFVQIIDPAEEESHYWGDAPANLRAIDIWIGEEAYLGQGHGTEIMRMAIDRCFAPPEVTAIIIDPLVSNTRSHRFYQRLGFAPIERRSFGADDCLVHRLDRAAWTSRASPPQAADRLLAEEGRRALDCADRRGPSGQRADAVRVAGPEPDSRNSGAGSRRRRGNASALRRCRRRGRRAGRPGRPGAGQPLLRRRAWN